MGEADAPTKGQGTTASFATKDFACGDYRLYVLSAGSASGGPAIWQANLSLCPRLDDPTFFFGVSGVQATNPYRQELMFQDLASHAMQNGSATVETPPGILDLGMKYGLRFGMRAQGAAKLTDAEREEALRRGPNGEKLPGAWEGGRPITGLLSPRVRETAAADMAKQVQRGQAAALTVRVLGASGKPLAGTQRLAVEVVTPKGSWAEITGAHATDDGVWTATLNPAANDVPGQWRVLVKELSSGMRGEAVVTVK